jgi:hypothetical protein
MKTFHRATKSFDFLAQAGVRLTIKKPWFKTWVGMQRERAFVFSCAGFLVVLIVR